MDKIKTIISALVLLIFFSGLSGQSANFDSMIKGFQTSYLNEATGNLQGAVDDLKSVYDEDSYEINLRLGWLSYSSGLFTESTSYYNRAIDLKSFAIEPRFGVILPTAAMGNWEIVINQYKHILEIAPSNTLAMHRLGLVYYGRKEYGKAEVLFNKVVNLFPFDYDGLLMLAWTKFQLKKYREAKVLFNKALMHTPGGQSAIEGLQLLD
jgi:tetratricopeptide (TPR) repeat protein